MLLALMAAAAAFFSAAVIKLNEDCRAEECVRLEASIRRACAACYATEGFYPPGPDYLEENYGLAPDTDRCRVFYKAFSANLMPQIAVIQIDKK